MASRTCTTCTSCCSNSGPKMEGMWPPACTSRAARSNVGPRGARRPGARAGATTASATGGVGSGIATGRGAATWRDGHRCRHPRLARRGAGERSARRCRGPARAAAPRSCAPGARGTARGSRPASRGTRDGCHDRAVLLGRLDEHLREPGMGELRARDRRGGGRSNARCRRQGRGREHGDELGGGFHSFHGEAFGQRDRRRVRRQRQVAEGSARRRGGDRSDALEANRHRGAEQPLHAHLGARDHARGERRQRGRDGDEPARRVGLAEPIGERARAAGVAED